MSSTEEKKDKKNKTPIPWRQFLKECPPGQTFIVKDLFEVLGSEYAGIKFKLEQPDIELYCYSTQCEGKRFFKTDYSPIILNEGQSKDLFLYYHCRNCIRSFKIFAVLVKPISRTTAEVFKYGELPPFGPHTPPRLITLIGPDRELFLTGRRAESQGMGIGAFAYYRRVVENQKGRIFDELIRVAEKINPDNKEFISSIKVAKAETQFTKAVESIRDAIPQVLLIDGHNPLTLLHSALSQGIHEHTDAQCLEFATSVRVVLTELAERLGQALKEKAELTDAVSKLLKVKSGKKSKNKKPEE